MTSEIMPAEGAILRCGENVLWLILNGELRRIPDRSTMDALFATDKSVLAWHDVADVPRGPDICHGSCLVRGDGSLGIFLVTGYPDTRRHRILSYEAFVAYGFNLEAVRNIPVIVLEQIPVGRDIDKPSNSV